MPTSLSIPRAAILAAVASAPIVFWPSASDIFGLPKLAVVVAGVVVAAVALVLGTDTSWRLPAAAATPAAWKVVSVYVAVFALATVFSVSRPTSLLGTYERYGGLLPLLVHVALAVLVVVIWWREPAATIQLAAAAVLGGVALATYVLFQVAGLDAIDWVEKSGGVVLYQAGTMGNSNFAAAYLGTVLSLVWPLLRWARSRWQRIAVAAAGVELAVALVATKGRGGLLAAVVGLVATLALARPRDVLGDRPLWPALAGATLVVISVGAYLVSSTDVLRTESVDVRKREWAGAVAVFAERPILGTGPDTFLLRYPQHRSARDGRELGLQIADKPHNLVLEHAATTGVLGVAAFVLLLATVAVTGVRWLRRQVELDDRLLGASFLGAAAGYYVQSLFSFEVPALAGLAWVLLAAVVVHADPVLEGARSSPTPKGKRKSTSPAPRAGARLVVPVVVAALVLAVATARFVLADGRAGRALSTAGEAGLAHAEAATSLHPWQPAYALIAGGTAEQLGATAEDERERARFLATSAAHYRAGLELQEDNVLLLNGLARTLTLTGRGVDPAAFTEADKTWRRAVELDPNDWELHTAHGLMLNSWANAGADTRRQAAEALRRSLEIRPEQPATWSTLALVLESLGDAPGAADAARRGADLAPDDPEARQLADRLTARAAGS